jgi:DNA-binding transcriptional MerR regulator
MSEPAIETMAQDIPDKLYFRIGEVSSLAGVKQHVLRYWETEFPGLGPKKAGKGHRLYRRKDVELVLEIKRLLYDQRFTIEGARKWLQDHKNSKPATASPPETLKPAKQVEMFPSVPFEGLDDIRRELKAILKILGP